MDALIRAAAERLAAGDPLEALKRVALREDASALALRGLAMAQLGDFARARALVKRAAKTFGPGKPLARARLAVAEAEIALASRELGWPKRPLESALATLDAHGDRQNGAHGRQVEIRRLVLIGRIGEAERNLARLDPASLSPALRAVHELIVAGIAIRRLQIEKARGATLRAGRAALEAGIPALAAEVESARRILSVPAARLIADGATRPLLLDEVEALLKSDLLVIDACRYRVQRAKKIVPLARRPVLFALVRALGEAWPSDVPRHALLARAFGARFADDSHRARLRVEIGRLRRVLKPLAHLNATARGFELKPLGKSKVVVLARPLEEEHGAILAMLADGESWSSSALALALARGQRSVQRALDELRAQGKVQSFGLGRSRRWTGPPLPGFTTALLLPVFAAGD